MIKLNDYLYTGHTIFRILQSYSEDLKKQAQFTHNEIDMVHCSFLLQIMEMLEHNDFLTSQSQRIREFYKFMAREYPYLAFTFKGRIKSLIRAEEKFNGYIVEYIYDYYKEYGRCPEAEQIKKKLSCFRDLIAYRIVISLPKCRVFEGQDLETEEIRYLYEIANLLPDFLKQRGFEPEFSGSSLPVSEQLKVPVRPYFRDYIENVSPVGYRSLHITFYDTSAHCYIELQLRTKSMDDDAEIGHANHQGYEKRQEMERARRDEIPVGMSIYFDEAYERGMALQNLDLAGLDVNMFAAIGNSLINDGCGLYRGRLITPFEHLSRFQNDLID